MKHNGYMDKYAQEVIKRLVDANELYTREQFEQIIVDNKLLDAKIMTIAVNRALGIGKKRFEEKVNPVLHRIEKNFIEWAKDMGEDEAIERIEKMYAEIMED